jgi:chromosome segregation ATPase
MESACTRASTLEGNVLDLELRLSEAERQLEQQKEDTELHLGNCRRLESELEAAQLLSQQFDDLQAEKDSLEEELQELQAELNSTFEKSEEDQRQFRETALQSMEEMKAAQAAERETFKVKLAKLTKSKESALEDVRSKLAIAEQQVSLVEKQVLRKNEELQGLQEQVVQLGKDKDRLSVFIKELENRHVEALSQAERQYQQGIQSLRQEVNGLRDANTRECMSLMESVRSAESRAALAEARLRDSSKQLESARNSDGPKIASLQTSVNSLTTQLQRAQAEVAHLKESKDDLNRRLKEALGNIKALTARCKDLGVQTEKEIASVKLTYERRISVLEQRLAEHL